MVHAVRDPAESVQSHVRILGDRSVLYKYLNPNTLFVATVPGDLPVGAESHLTAHVIDTVSQRHLSPLTASIR
jgi:hypothetical protein